MSFKVNVHDLFFEQSLSIFIKNLAEKHHTTNYVILLTFLFESISLYTDETKIVIATPASNRVHYEFFYLIGLFTNFILLSFAIDPNINFSEKIKRCHNELINALNNQEVPYAQVCEIKTLFDNNKPTVVFAYENTMPNLNLDTVTTQMVNTKIEYSPNELWIIVIENNGNFICRFVYRDCLYSEEIIQQFASDFQRQISRDVGACWANSTKA